MLLSFEQFVNIAVKRLSFVVLFSVVCSHLIHIHDIDENINMMPHLQPMQASG